MKKALNTQLREQYGRINYSLKTHFKDADLLRERSDRIKFWQVILTTSTTTGVFGTLISLVLGQNDAAPYIAGAAAVLTTLSTLLSVYFRNFNPEELIEHHRGTARVLWRIREDYLNLLTDLSQEALPLETVKEQRDRLTRQLEQVYESAPITSPRAYDLAKSALKEGEEMFFSDDELDKMLPAHLRTKHGPMTAAGGGV